MKIDKLIIFLGLSFPLSLLHAKLWMLPLFSLFLLILYAFQQASKKVKSRNEIRTQSHRFLFHLALSLRISPNFEEAVRFAFENSGETLRREIGVYIFRATLGQTSYEHALEEFARKWDLELFTRLLPILRSSIEMRPHEREQTLDEAVRQILEYEREGLFSFCSWLHHPLLILYSVGILLPVALLPSLPVLSAFGLNLGTAGLLSFLLFSLILTHLASQYLIAKSPLFHQLEDAKPVTSHVLLSPLAGLPFLWLGGGELKIWMLLWVPTLFLCFFLWTACQEEVRRRRESLQMEEELPAVLRQVGGSMIKGQSAEEALLKLRGGKLSELLRKGSLNVLLGNLDLHSSLFDPRKGVLREIQSNEIKEALTLAFSVVRRSTSESGRTLIKLSDHLTELRRVKGEGQRLLSTTVSSMRSLSLFFGPAILAITARMFLLLQIKGSVFLSVSLNPSVLLLILGTYCLGMCWILLTLCHRVGGGDRNTERYLLAQALPLSLAVFTVFSLFGYQLIESLLK